MRVLLCGAQSSGASFVTLLVAQNPGTIALIDLWNHVLSPPLPELGDADVVAKFVVTRVFDLEEHFESFRPDRTVLVLRSPIDNYVALRRKQYVDESGCLDEKFEALESTYLRRDRFDAVVRYEDCALQPNRVVETLRGAGIPIQDRAFDFPRSVREIIDFNKVNSAWARDHYGVSWAFGNVRGEWVRSELLFKRSDSATRAHVRRLCPELCRDYDAYLARHVNARTRFRSVWLYDFRENYVRRWAHGRAAI